jgi:hypothetical protein
MDGSLTTFMLPNDAKHATAGRIHHFDAELVVPAEPATGDEMLQADLRPPSVSSSFHC